MSKKKIRQKVNSRVTALYMISRNGGSIIDKMAYISFIDSKGKRADLFKIPPNINRMRIIHENCGLYVYDRLRMDIDKAIKKASKISLGTRCTK